MQRDASHSSVGRCGVGNGLLIQPPALDKNYEVNSYHNFSIKTCPKDFNITAKSMDGEIEAIKHKKYALEGWMWHPEREEEYKIQDIKNIKRIFKS